MFLDSLFAVALVRRQKEFRDKLKLEDLFFVYGLQCESSMLVKALH
jgi:hypothetical protein